MVLSQSRKGPYEAIPGSRITAKISQARSPVRYLAADGGQMGGCGQISEISWWSRVISRNFVGLDTYMYVCVYAQRNGSKTERIRHVYCNSRVS
jgi:hypothetical protein